ncbi:MAG TPA: M48 family metalloprotease [Candidatus Saccharimonadales bacterium]|nr:M48 family metalloprotease [Candidatus Saccharimonadales bacterium]
MNVGINFLPTDNLNLLIIKFLIFISIFLFVCNYFQIISFLKIFIGPKIKTEPLNDKWINSTVKKKTGLNLITVTLFKDKKLYGMMAGLPFWPKMILSEGLYKTLNKEELEWVILHEAGHCILWHNLEAAFFELGIEIVGIYTIALWNISLILVPLYALLLSFICIQVIRWLIEYVADRFSIARVDNPQGVISAQDKFRKCYKGSKFDGEHSLLRFLIHWNIYPEQRIKMARERMASL